MTTRYPYALTCCIGLEKDNKRDNFEITVAPADSLQIGGPPRAATNTATGGPLVVEIRDGGAVDLPRIVVDLPDGGSGQLPLPMGHELPPGTYGVSLQIDDSRVLHTILDTGQQDDCAPLRLSHGVLPDTAVPVPPEAVSHPAPEPTAPEPTGTGPFASGPPVDLDPALIEWGITDVAAARAARRRIEECWREYAGKPGSEFGKPRDDVGRSRIDYFFLSPHQLPPSLARQPGRSRDREQERWFELGTEIWQELKKRLELLDVRRPKQSRGAQDEFRQLYQRLRELDGGAEIGPLTRPPFED